METSRGAAIITARQGVAILDDLIFCLWGLVVCAGQTLRATQQDERTLAAEWPR